MKKKKVIKKSRKKAKTKPASKKNITSKIKGLALKTQKSVQGQIHTQTEALRNKLSAYGIGVDDVKAKAKHLEQVLKDLRTREFLQKPGVQTLVEKVTRKSVEKANVEAQSAAQKVPRKASKKSAKEKAANEKRFRDVAQKANQQLGTSVVQAILKRVEDVRKTFGTNPKKSK